MKRMQPLPRIHSIFEVGMDRVIPPIKLLGNGRVINLGAGNKQLVSTEDLDWPDWDADTMPMPYNDESISGFYAFHFLEHVKSPAKVLLEVQRCLKVGGSIIICVPYYNSQMQAQDQDHKHSFCEETWRIMFNNPYYDKQKVNWRFEIGTNVIMGVVERNLCLITQLIKS